MADMPDERVFPCCLDGIKKGERNTLVDLADLLTRLRAKQMTQKCDDRGYLRALDDIAGAMKLNIETVKTVRWTA